MKHELLLAESFTSTQDMKVGDTGILMSGHNRGEVILKVGRGFSMPISQGKFVSLSNPETTWGDPDFEVKLVKFKLVEIG